MGISQGKRLTKEFDISSVKGTLEFILAIDHAVLDINDNLEKEKEEDDGRSHYFGSYKAYLGTKDKSLDWNDGRVFSFSEKSPRRALLELDLELLKGYRDLVVELYRKGKVRKDEMMLPDLGNLTKDEEFLVKLNLYDILNNGKVYLDIEYNHSC